MAKLTWRALGHGKGKAGSRDSIDYFDQGGNLNAIRWKDWKLNFAVNSEGNIPPEVLHELRVQSMREI